MKNNGTFKTPMQRREERLGRAVHKALRELQRCYRRSQAEQRRIAPILREVQRAWAACEKGDCNAPRP